jgi:hypothetical protein
VGVGWGGGQARQHTVQLCVWLGEDGVGHAGVEARSVVPWVIKREGFSCTGVAPHTAGVSWVVVGGRGEGEGHAGVAAAMLGHVLAAL